VQYVGVDTPIVVALITSVGSLVVAISTTAWSARQNNIGRSIQGELADKQSASQSEVEQLKHALNLAARDEERRFEAIAQLNRLREPLLVAASDLGERIDNIRHRGFLRYLQVEGHRCETATMSTQFRFARYFARLESLYSVVSIMRFERGEDTKAVARLLGDIGRTFASDRWPTFMLWREEQRAIGELMLEPKAGNISSCAGYSTFVNDYEGRFRRWFATFAEDLESPGAERSERLARLQELLASLVIQLDDGREYVHRDEAGHVTTPKWIVRSTK
jgi:hypothetical protein